MSSTALRRQPCGQRVCALIVLLLLGVKTPARADTRVLATEILTLVHAEQRWTETVEFHRRGWLEGYKPDSDAAGAINDFFDQHMTWGAAEPHLVTAIVADYSGDELASMATVLAAEYGSPAPSPQYRARFGELTSLGLRIGQKLATPLRDIVKQYPDQRLTPIAPPPEPAPADRPCDSGDAQPGEFALCIER